MNTKAFIAAVDKLAGFTCRPNLQDKTAFDVYYQEYMYASFDTYYERYTFYADMNRGTIHDVKFEQVFHQYLNSPDHFWDAPKLDWFQTEE